MSEELNETLGDVWLYFSKTMIYVKPIWAMLASVISYVFVPQESYFPAAIALVCALLIDIITKYYSVSVLNGGLKNAIKIKKLTSENLWRGTKKKIVSVLIVMILCGLSFRISSISSIAILLTTFSYGFMFLRESQSIIENLLDAGHEDLRWLLFFIKKKQKEVLDLTESDRPTTSENEQEVNRFT